MAKTAKIFARAHGSTQTSPTYTVPNGKFAILNVMFSGSVPKLSINAVDMPLNSESVTQSIRGIVIPAATTVVAKTGAGGGEIVVTGFEYDV